MREALELYVHIPFCARKCNYCDFLSFPAAQETQNAYLKQMITEIEFTSAMCRDYEISSVFIGGGTPSLLEPAALKSILDCIRYRYRLAKDAEVTVECNPGSLLRHKFSVYREAGVNRLSIGLQSADRDELQTLGRIHTYEEFLKCYQGARMEGFNNVNVDLICGVPGQSFESWKKTLRSVVMLKPEHLSVYDLIVEEGTPFARMREEGTLSLPDEDTSARMDEFTRSFLGSHGFERYEVSNWARPGKICRHNTGYWTGVPYLGFGIGAASYFDGYRWSNTRVLSEYLSVDFENTAEAFAGIRRDLRLLSEKERMEEFMYLGLRRTCGVSGMDFLTTFSRRMESVFGETLEKYCAEGLIIRDGYIYRLSERGMDVSNRVLCDFLLD